MDEIYRSFMMVLSVIGGLFSWYLIVLVVLRVLIRRKKKVSLSDDDQERIWNQIFEAIENERRSERAVSEIIDDWARRSGKFE